MVANNISTARMDDKIQYRRPLVEQLFTGFNPNFVGAPFKFMIKILFIA